MVARRWQLAHRTTHFAISASMRGQLIPVEIITETSKSLSRTWSN
jgi:hypothetical protein